MLIADSLSNIFFLIYIDHFLASNELRNWPPILIKFLTISQSQKTPPKNKQQTKENPANMGTTAQLKLSVNYAMYRLVSMALKSFWDHDTLLLKYFFYLIPIFI